jgi:hypothetical protein
MQIADANAQAGLSVLYFHVELTYEQILARRYCRFLGEPVHAILTQQLNQKQREAVDDAVIEIGKWPGQVDFVHSISWDGERLVQELKTRHSDLIASQGHGYDLVVLDSLQRLNRPSRFLQFDEHEALAANIRMFSDCLIELSLAGLMTSQVVRSNSSNQFDPPALDTGLGTSYIENCSNQILALAIADTGVEIKYTVRKNTFGEPGASGTLIYDARRLQFL